MARTSTPKSNSLKELGFTVTATHGKDENGNEWAYKVKGPAPEFFIKKTKKGRLVAYRAKDAKIESTIEGLQNFKEEQGEGGVDLVGTRTPSTPTTKKAPQPVAVPA